MTNIVWCVKGKNLSQENVLAMKENLKFVGEISLFVLCEKSQAQSLLMHSKNANGINVLVFPDQTKEDDMISSCIKSLGNVAPLVLIRSGCNFHSAENISLLIEKIKSGADVAMLKSTKKGGKIRAWFGKTYKKLCELFFGFKFFEGNIAMVAFSETAHKILKETPIAKMTKINRWIGVDVEYIEKKSLPKNTPQKAPLSMLINTFVWAGVLASTLFLIIFFAIVGTLSIASFWLLVGGILLSTCMLAYRLLVLISFKYVGNVQSKTFVDFERREL